MLHVMCIVWCQLVLRLVSVSVTEELLGMAD